MRGIDMRTAKATYGGSAEEEILMNMAKRMSCYPIHKYANGFGDKNTH
jgi:hypothetical protein